MAMGQFAAGVGVLGIDPAAPPPPAPPEAKLEALYFDPFTRDYLLDEHGRAVSIHPTDQKVALALSVLKDSLSGAKTFGTSYPFGRFRPDTLSADVDKAVRSALAFLVSAGEILIRAITATLEPHGRVLCAIEYTNLLLPLGSAPHITLRVSF